MKGQITGLMGSIARRPAWDSVIFLENQTACGVDVVTGPNLRDCTIFNDGPLPLVECVVTVAIVALQLVLFLGSQDSRD